MLGKAERIDALLQAIRQELEAASSWEAAWERPLVDVTEIGDQYRQLEPGKRVAITITYER